MWNERGAEGLGEYSVFTLWSYPVNFIFGILSFLGLNFQIWERILVSLFILIGSLSIWKLLSFYSLSNRAKLIGSLFYLINTYPILLIDGGQISIALAYGLFPLVFLKIAQITHSNLKGQIIVALTISLLGFFDIRFLFVTFLLMLIKAFFDVIESQEKRLATVFRWAKAGFITSLFILLLNFFWILTYIKVPIDKDLLDSFTKISTDFLNIGYPILVISPHWYKNVFGKISQLKIEFILLPILVLLAPIFRRKNRTVLFWISVASISIFLVKGGGEPLSFIYPFLHSSIPGFSLFRDSTKFFFLLTLSYAVLISIASEEILKRLKKNLQFIYLFTILLYFLYLIRPVFFNQMTGTFSTQPAENDFTSLSNILQKDKEFGRVFWIPATAPLSYSDLNHPIVEAVRVFDRIPFKLGVKGSYETFNFLREAPYMGEIFDVSGISYLTYPYPDTRRENLSPDDINYYYTFLNQLTNLPWMKERISDSKVPLLKTKIHQDKIFITKNTWIAFGTDEIFKEATKSAKQKLSNNAVIFAESKPEMGSLISNYPEAKISLNKKTSTDLMATFIKKSQIIFPSLYLRINPDSSGWWKNDGTNLIAWRDFLQSKYKIDNKDFDLGGGWAVGEGNLELRIQNPKFKKNAILLARVMESSRSGELSFYQENNLIGEVSTRDMDTKMRWFEIGSLSKNTDLVIKTQGDVNVINSLAVIDSSDLASYKQKTGNLFRQIKDFKQDNILEDNSSVSYQKINQTKYKVFVSNLTYPQMVVFSSAYHSGWKLNGQDSIPVYGFLNGFRVDKNGEYVLEFAPQKFVYPGLIVSIITLLIVFALLLV